MTLCCAVSTRSKLCLVRNSVSYAIPRHFHFSILVEARRQPRLPSRIYKLVSGDGRLLALGFFQQPLDAFHMLLRKIQREVELRNATHLQPLD